VLESLYFHLPIGGVSCLSRAFVLGIILSSQALLARRKRVGFEQHLILFSASCILIAAEILGICLSLLDSRPEIVLPPAMWGWYPVLSSVGLLGLAFCFDFMRLTGGEPDRGDPRPSLRSRSLRFLVAAGILFALGALLMQAPFARDKFPTSRHQMGSASYLLHGIQAAAMALLGWKALFTRRVWLSRTETRIFVLGAAVGVSGALLQIFVGPQEYLTTFAFTLFVGVLLRDNYRRSELDAVRASTERTAHMLLFHRITTQLKSTSDLPQLYQIALTSLLDHLHAESGAIYLGADGDSDLSPARIQGPYPPPLPLGDLGSRDAVEVRTLISSARVPPGAGVIGRVAATGAPLYIASADDAAAHYTWPTGAVHVRTAIALPLRGPAGIFGVIQVVNRRDGAAFSESDLRFTSLIAEQAGLAIYDARLHAEMVQRQRAEEQLRVAREIQLRMIPAEPPHIPGLSLGAEYMAAEEVGGDYFDFYRIDHDHLGVVIFDVAGRGVPAALLMAITSTFFKMAAPRSNSPAWVLNEVNAALAAEMRQGLYVTALYGVLRFSTLQFTFVCAGHTDAIVIQEGKPVCVRHRPRGAALGLLRPNRFRAVMEQETIQLREGDTLLLYTDGVVEATNDEGEQFGEDRLCEVALAHAADGARRLAAEIKDAVRRHSGSQRQEDDLTILTLHIAPEPETPAREPQPELPESEAESHNEEAP
jgi:sigma-B regulation protein RsbU (phosphoserine phosphatase)